MVWVAVVRATGKARVAVAQVCLESPCKLSGLQLTIILCQFWLVIFLETIKKEIRKYIYAHQYLYFKFLFVHLHVVLIIGAYFISPEYGLDLRLEQ